LDTDVELIKPFDGFLDNKMFIGFESNKQINTGLGVGAEKNFHIVKKMLDIYDNLSFINIGGVFNMTSCPIYNTAVMKQEGFKINNTQQTLNNITVYPTEYFCPIDTLTKKMHVTENTHAIHHFDGSWLTADEKQEKIIISKYRKKYGEFLGEILYIMVAVCTVRKSGINNILEKIKYKVKNYEQNAHNKRDSPYI
jgi:hypothetical protein